MDFGKLPSIDKVDFTLPADHPETSLVLEQSVRLSATPQVYVGCPVWATREWVGKWYPSTAKEKDYLHHYARQFNTIELNTTHYRIPDLPTIERWYEAASPGFTFCPKWPQQISHDSILTHVESATKAFGEAILGLREKLGVSFLQLPPGFSPRQDTILEQFVTTLTPKVPLAIEFRHQDWFTNSPETQKVFAMLREQGVGTVISDVAGRRDVVHMRLTTSMAMIRFVGNGLHPTDYQRIDQWVTRLQQWFEQGLQTLYFFIHEPDPNTLSPELAVYLVRQLNEICGLQIKEPKPLPQVVQGSLFG
jgi:uncharacterized protein YecE (DUF72 family)